MLKPLNDSARRLRELRQSLVGAERDPDDERVPGGRQETQGAAEATQVWRQSVLAPRRRAELWLWSKHYSLNGSHSFSLLLLQSLIPFDKLYKLAALIDWSFECFF